MAKICVLNYRFYDAFFYELKALLTYVKERFYFDSFDEVCYEDLSRKRLIPKTCELDDKDEMGDVGEDANFEFVEDVVVEAATLFEKFCHMVLKYTPDQIDVFLKQVKI